MFHHGTRLRTSVFVGFLFLLLAGGTAYAAHRYLITTTSQIKPSVREALRGDRGRAGPTGPSGAPGVTGATGSLAPTLLSGDSETGVYEADGTSIAVGTLASTSISFSVPLAGAPTENVIASGTTAACPGSASAPTASPGELCIYEGSQQGIGEISAYNPLTGTAGASRYGAGLVIDSSAVTGNFSSSGTWAVTAP